MSASRIESSLTLKRIYDVPVGRLWRAWTDSAELGQCYVAGSDHIVHFCEADVRVGGTYRVGFGPPDRKPYVETGRYMEVEPPSRLVFEETVSNSEGEHIHTHVTVVEFRDLGGSRSQLILTSLGPESWRTGEGWTPALESLAAYLAKTSLNREDRMTNADNSVLKVRRSIHIAAPPSRIWQEFTSKPRMDGWWGKIRSTPVAGQSNGQHLRTYEPKLGGRIEMEVDMGGSRARCECIAQTSRPGSSARFVSAS